ncbi:MAG: prolyl oligopeptidase family serine peptidase [Holophagales bacterium]|nr:prolyl oligopeptidase family serine peptidase [Holophagales bacterium]
MGGAYPSTAARQGAGRASDAIDYGGLEVDDVVAGLDWAVADLPYVDGSRAAIAGWSHGGLIALLAVMPPGEVPGGLRRRPSDRPRHPPRLPRAELRGPLRREAPRREEGRRGRRRVPEAKPRLLGLQAQDAAPDPRHDERPRRERARDGEPGQRPEGGREEVRGPDLQGRPSRALLQPDRHAVREGVAQGDLGLPRSTSGKPPID